ncbi:MAG: imidazole glycerol phosphate synthase subunit HisH [Gammaproteobacteria bacterium]|nr:imidazole glycerol phosphate synthase subunit HisH [Gammaproteobacteria bacterium]
MRVAVIDFGSGNLRSVSKATERVAPGAKVVVTSQAEVIDSADRIIFPGQGAIGACVAAMETLGLKGVLLSAIRNKPFLGICLGLQVLYEASEEDGGTAGLSVLDGQVRHFNRVGVASDNRDALKIPHMGWNNVHQTRDHPLWRDIPNGARFYFVHSYCAVSANDSEICGTTDYGGTFVSAAGRENVFAVQFHPEKSQNHGLHLLRNFVEWDGT